MRKIINTIAALSITVAVYGQNVELTKLNLKADSLTISEFIELVEVNYPVNFYYNPEWLDNSKRFNVDYKDVKLRAGVEDYFKNFGLNIYEDLPDIYLVKGVIPKTKFARKFYQSLASKTPVPQEIIEEKYEEHVKEVLNGSLNEKVQFGNPSPNSSGNKYYMRGYVLDAETGQSIIGATIQVAGTSTGSATNIDGYYSLVIPSGHNEIIFRAVGKKTARRVVAAFDNGNLDVSLFNNVKELDQITVVAQNTTRMNRMDGAEKMDMVVLNKSIMIMGETDILKGLLTLPGVQSASEVTTGYNVRGGSTDQNLILLDDAPIMNMSHFFGFFSNINADVVQNTELYKSGMPASMGGRVASILEINSRSGDFKKYNVNGGISPVAAHLTLDGPLLKDKISFVGSGRSTYSDWLLKKVGDERVRNSSASFYDYFGKISMKFNKDQNLFVTFYTSNDNFKFDKIQTQNYSNLVLSSGFNSPLGKSMLYKANFSYSAYNSSMRDESIPIISSSSSFGVSQYTLNNRFNWKKNRWINLGFGFGGVYYNIDPGSVYAWGDESRIEPVILDNERAIEGSLYFQNEQTISNWLKLSYGIRYTAYGYLGPADIYDYVEGVSKSKRSLVDTTSYSNNELINSYSGPEFRFLGKIILNAKSTIKFSYNRTRQYIGLISNSVLPAPTDFWKLSNPHIQPKIGDIVSLGYFNNIVLSPSSSIELSLEAYYRNTQNILDYKTGAALFANSHFETEIIQGTNRSYGVEVQIKRDKGALTGWLNYTYARSLNRFTSDLPEEKINNGVYFPANYDKPHQMNLVANYDFFRRLRVATNIQYSTGRPITLPEATFMYKDKKRIQFSDRNQFRLADFFRVDLTATIEGDYRRDKMLHGSLSFSVINLTGRNNPYSVFFDYNKRGQLKAYSLSIYGVPIFTLTYKFKF